MEKELKKDKKSETSSNNESIFTKLICISCKKNIETNIDHKCEYRCLNKNILIKSLK